MRQPQSHCRTRRPWTAWGLWLAIGVAMLLTVQVWRMLGDGASTRAKDAGNNLVRQPAPVRH